MRARLTASFVVLTVLLLFGALWIRSYNEYTQLRTHESRELRGDATTLALVVEQREQLGEPVDRAFLAGIVDSVRPAGVRRRGRRAGRRRGQGVRRGPPR